MTEIRLYNAAELDKHDWGRLHAVSREAFSTLNRSREEIEALIGWNDPVRFFDSHIDPNTEVGRRYYANQSYTRPKVAVALQGNEEIGFAYSANNVSGESELIRRAKRASIVKNHLWLREVAVKPNYQRQGIARALGETLLKDAISFQPVATYIWPEEIPFLNGLLERLGFSPTGEDRVKLFGENSAPVRQVRMQAPSVSAVFRNLE